MEKTFFSRLGFYFVPSEIHPFLFSDQEDPQQSIQLVVYHWMFFFLSQDESYDLHDRKAFAKFLIDADIRLVSWKSHSPGLFSGSCLVEGLKKAARDWYDLI